MFQSLSVPFRSNSEDITSITNWKNSHYDETSVNAGNVLHNAKSDENYVEMPMGAFSKTQFKKNFAPAGIRTTSFFFFFKLTIGKLPWRPYDPLSNALPSS
jgi:hypothetical protein